MFHFDIFCRVVDNYGDIGVCWRLARQLAAPPHHKNVRLWVDDLQSFKRLEPRVDLASHQQEIDGVTVYLWNEDHAFPTPAEVVIEAFACELPNAYKAGITSQSLWLNLEYLSAEDWVEDCHAQPSPQAQGQHKYFFFPGFTERTGGLLREHELKQQRLRWQQDQRNAQALWTKIGLSERTQIELMHGQRRQILLFSYPSAPVMALLQALQQGSHDTIVLSPTAFTPEQQALANDHLLLHHFDFVSQHEFDQLLWSSDLNFVRGEDSLVRAIWAAKPFIWQPYEQEEGLHTKKLQALLNHSPMNQAVQTLMHTWSSQDSLQFTDQYLSCMQAPMWHRWREEALQWHNTLLQQEDLCTHLLDFCTKHQPTQ